MKKTDGNGVMEGLKGVKDRFGFKKLWSCGSGQVVMRDAQMVFMGLIKGDKNPELNQLYAVLLIDDLSVLKNYIWENQVLVAQAL